VRDAARVLAEVAVSPVMTAGGELYRVRLGPFATREEAERALGLALAAGFAGARLASSDGAYASVR
jgi:cell division protein FtsN